MKTRLHLLTSLIALVGASAFSQPQPAQPITVPERAIPQRALKMPPGSPTPILTQPETPKLTTFSLDFPGGTPQQLVTAIEKAMGKPLNVIIPAEHADFKLPPLKMNQVNVWQLFQALELTSQKTEAYVTGTYYSGSPSHSYQTAKTSYGFRSPSAQSGAVSDDSIWYFYVEKPVMPPQVVSSVVPSVCRFYPLTSYLERGLTVDDITTAIQTGWKMLGDQETPTISFHKETKLLIAVGDPAKLETIDAVLKALSPTSEGAFGKRIDTVIHRLPADGSSSPPAKPDAKPKTEN